MGERIKSSVNGLQCQVKEPRKQSTRLLVRFRNRSKSYRLTLVVLVFSKMAVAKITVYVHRIACSSIDLVKIGISS